MFYFPPHKMSIDWQLPISTDLCREIIVSDQNESIANALELLLINQNGIGAAVEELAKWVAERGSTETARNALGALETLDTNAEGIASAIRALRS